MDSADSDAYGTRRFDLFRYCKRGRMIRTTRADQIESLCNQCDIDRMLSSCTHGVFVVQTLHTLLSRKEGWMKQQSQPAGVII